MKITDIAVRLFASFTFISNVSPAVLEKYIWRPDLKLSESYVLRQLDGISKVECAVSCSLDTQCQSVSFLQNPRRCLLSDKDVAHREWFLFEALESAPGWLTFGVDVFHVVLLRPPNTRYELTFSQARQICVDHNLTLASSAQLLQARALGHQTCTCGWLSDGFSGFTLQAPSPCYYRFSTGILQCSRPRADAWCFIP